METHGFVAEQDRRILQHHSRHRKSLLLPAADHQSAFADHRFVTIWQSCDRLVDVSFPRGFYHLLVTGIKASVANIVHNIRVEERRVLRDDANGTSQRFYLNASDILAVDGYPPSRRLIEAVQQAEDRGLSTA